MVITDKYIFFFRKNDPFSNGYPCTFVCNCFGGKKFNCVEQYMMYCKAMVFDQDNIANQIMNTNDPAIHKKLGRSIPNFDQKYGMNFAEDIVFDGLFFKYTQNNDLLQQLLLGLNKTFVESSPYDKIGGVGLDTTDYRIHDESQGKGKNLLGKCHNKVLTELFKSKGTKNLLFNGK